MFVSFLPIYIYIYRKEFSHDGARMYNEVYISVYLVTFYVSIMYLYCLYLCQLKIKKKYKKVTALTFLPMCEYNGESDRTTSKNCDSIFCDIP